MNAPIRVLVVDDMRLVREGFCRLINGEPDMEAVGEAGTGVEAVAMAADLRPDVVLMDIFMPEMDGIEAARQIIRGAPETTTRVLMLTTFDFDEYVYGALNAGASGFLLKQSPTTELLTAIRVVAGGEALLSPKITQRVIAEFARRPPPGRPVSAELSGLTDREREVLLLIARGFSNPQIEERLGLRPATVKTHISHLLAKLGARDRAHLVIAAYESGLVTPAVQPLSA